MAPLPDSPVATKPEQVSVKINADVYRLVRTVAAWKGVNISDYLSEIVEPIARRDMAKMQKEASKGGKEEGE